MMIRTLFTLDYEIHGNGDGCPYRLMVEPTRRLMKLFDEVGARLTIMADMAEIKRFSDYRMQTGCDDYHYDLIVAQLREALRRGHDVQLHLHPSYFHAHQEAGGWAQDWSEYNLATLPLERLNEVIGFGKTMLEHLLQPVDPDYRCIAFRSANWSMSPSRNLVRALISQGIRIDTSVFKYGQRHGLVNYDYRAAPSAMWPWRVDENDICTPRESGELLEFPIYSENRWIGAFVTPQRIHRALLSRRHRVAIPRAGDERQRTASPTPRGVVERRRSLPWRRYAWKADFNQCSGRQLIRALLRAERAGGGGGGDIPFVLIGHSKLYSRLNGTSLRPFLRFIAAHPDRFGFATFSSLDLESYGPPLHPKEYR